MALKGAVLDHEWLDKVKCNSKDHWAVGHQDDTAARASQEK